MRVLTWTMVVAVILSFAGGWLTFLLLCIAAAVVIAPGATFLGLSVRSKGFEIPPGTLKAVTLSGTGTVIIGWITLGLPTEMMPGAFGDFLFNNLGPPSATLMLLGVAMILRAWTAKVIQPSGAPAPSALPYGRAMGGALLVAIIASWSPAAFRGVSPDKVYVTILKSDLRNLEAEQYRFFNDSGRYANSLAALPLFKPTPDTRLEMVAGKAFWSATNSHPRLRGMTCAVAVGTPNPVSGDTAKAGEPLCGETKR